jgi:uncharacterized protein
MSPLKMLYILLGTFALLLGITGVFVPGLPTTPFLLLTAWLYLKGSEKLHNRLLKTKVVGNYIREYQKQKGMTLKQKISSIGVMWFMITLSVLFFIPDITVKIIVLIVGIIGTAIMGFVVRTAKICDHPDQDKKSK